jgi:hypothetical protein
VGESVRVVQKGFTPAGLAGYAGNDEFDVKESPQILRRAHTPHSRTAEAG